MLSARWQPFQKMLSVAGSVGVPAGVVLGADAGVLVYGVSGPLYVSIGEVLALAVPQWWPSAFTSIGAGARRPRPLERHPPSCPAVGGDAACVLWVSYPIIH